MRRNIIWSSSVEREFNNLLKKNAEMHLTEDELWAAAAEAVNEDLLQTVSDLNIATNALLVAGIIHKWGKTCHTKKVLKARNIGRAIMEVINTCTTGSGIFELYVENDSLMLSQRKDESSEASVYEIREGSADDNCPCGEFVSAVYNWAEEESMSA